MDIGNTNRKNFSVTLTPCPLKKNTYIARVPRKTITTNQLLDLVISHNTGIDRYQVAHAMDLLKKEIVEQAELGYAVDIMDICKLYIAPLSSVQSLTPEAETVTGFEARFAVKNELKEKLKNITATVTSVVDSSPQISQIKNLVDGSYDRELKATFSARIKGKKLKVGGSTSGVYFIPVLEDGSPNKNEESWIKVQDEFMVKNSATTLEFYIPRELIIGEQYYIAIRTQIRGSLKLKNPVTGFSKVPVTIKE